MRRTRSTPAATALLALLVTTLLQPLAHAAEPAAAPALEAWAIKSVPLPAHDSAYDKLRNKVLVTVRSSHPSLGNMLVEIDPDTGTLGRRVFVGSEPKQLAVTDDGAFAYVGLGGANRVVKVDLSTFAVALSFATGPDTGVNGPLFPEEIEPLPGRNDAVAVVLSDRIFGHEGIWIFVDGVQLPSHTDDQTDTDRMEFVSPSEIMGFRDHNGYYSMLRYAVDASGIRRTGYRQEPTPKKAVDFRFMAGKLYYSSGLVVDAVTGLTVPGLPVDNGKLVEVHPARSQVSFLSGKNVSIFDSTTSGQVAARTFAELPAEANAFVATGDGLVVAAKDAVFVLGPNVGGEPVQIPPAPPSKIAGWQVHQVPMKVNDMAYDKVRDLLYVTTAGHAETDPHSLLAVHPQTGEVVKSIVLGNWPGPIALSDDHSRLFVGIERTGQIKQIDLSTFSVIKTFSLGHTPFVAATDIAVMPGDRNTVAVVLHEEGMLDWDAGISLYRNGVQVGRTKVQSGPEDLAFGDAGNLYGVDWGGRFRRMTVDESGVHMEATFRDIMTTTSNLTITDGIAYSTQGDAVDPVRAERLGRFDAGTDPNGLIQADSFVAIPALGRGFLSRFWGVVEEYDLKEFRLISTFQMPAGLHLYNIVDTGKGLAGTGGGGLVLLTPKAPPPTPAPQPAVAWGYNGLGAVGVAGSGLSPSTPVGLTGVTQVSAGTYHSLALKSDGTVWSWGYNATGALGDRTTTDRPTPVQVYGLRKVVAVSAGMLHSVALTEEGFVYSWGWNGYGQLGNGSTVDSSTATRVNSLTGAASVSAGALHSLMAKRDGTVWSWGYNALGQLGDGTTIDRHHPVKVSTISNALGVSAGGFHSGGVDGLGRAWGWGWNVFGQLGDGTTVDRRVPVRLTAAGDFVQVSAGYLHTLARTRGGATLAWGYNGFGQVGDGTAVDRLSPKQITASGATDVSAGMFHSLAASNGSALGWGWNGFGQVGNGNTVDQRIPTVASGAGKVVRVSAGGLHSLGVRG